MKIVKIPITTLVVFEWDKENPIPYKFKYQGRTGKEITVRVSRIMYKEKIIDVPGPKYILYDCQGVLNGIERRYTLKYFFERCQWELYKI